MEKVCYYYVQNLSSSLKQISLSYLPISTKCDDVSEYALHILKLFLKSYLEIIFHVIQLKDLSLVPVTIC